MLNLNFDLPQKTTPIRCSQGSPGGCSYIIFHKREIDIILLEYLLKNYGGF